MPRLDLPCLFVCRQVGDANYLVGQKRRFPLENRFQLLDVRRFMSPKIRSVRTSLESVTDGNGIIVGTYRLRYCLSKSSCDRVV